MGRKHFRGCPGSPRTECGCGYPFHFFVARESDGPVADVSESGIFHRFDLRGIVISVSNASGTRREAGHCGEGVCVALVGTGVNPGFVMDKLVVTLAAVSQRIEHAKALRVVDASKRRLPLQKKIGAGMTVEEFRAQVKAGVIKHVGLPESVAMVADSLNLPVEQITETIEPQVATERTETEDLTVEAGQAAGVHQIGRGLSKDGKELVYLELQMYVGAKEPGDTISLSGHPNVSLVIPGGAHGDIATASVVVNSIPVILDAPAGLRTSRDLPIGFFSPNARP